MTEPADDLNALDDESFRRIVREWVQANYPADIRHPPQQAVVYGARRKGLAGPGLAA